MIKSNNKHEIISSTVSTAERRDSDEGSVEARMASSAVETAENIISYTPRIYPLPPSLINQMAAGEVIERPASVVKELLENALDAQAHHIDIHIEAAGVQLIEISDDGVGIHPEDLPLSIMSHATSKIRTLEDLFSVESLGFRGEALASIASVSRCSITSRQADCTEGYKLTFDDIKQEAHVSPQARTQGTTVSVQDLFFNTPVRRQFLSSEKTEWTQIENMVKRLALSRFDVAFHLKHKANTVFHLPLITDMQHAGIEARIKKIFGSAFLAQSESFEAEREGMRLWGWIGLPSFMRSQNDYQYFYLNGRLIRDKLIGHAIRAAYEGHLYPGRQPVFLIYLEMPPEQVDVNVHPTKHEVRFREQRQVHDFIFNQLSQKLRGQTNNYLPLSSNHLEETRASYNANTSNHAITANSTHLKSSPLDLHWIEPPYCLIKSENTLFLCHYTRLYQHFCRQRFLREITAKTITTRPFLVPIRLTPAQHVLQAILKIIPQLEKLGLSLNALDDRTLLIRAFPATLPYLNINAWLAYWEKRTLSSSDNESLIESLVQANHSPVPASSHDLQALLSDFQQYLIQPEIPSDLKQSVKIMKEADWEAILKSPLRPLCKGGNPFVIY